MGEFDLLTAVQPVGGWYAVVGIGEDYRKQKLVETREEFDAQVEQFRKRGLNVFFGVAKYNDDSSRTKHNVYALKALWLDIDCGPTKDYPSQQDALLALQGFCKTVGLPKPTIVNSGRGLHVYWPLDEELTRAEWEPLAARLKDVCLAQGMRVDPVVFEAARILRVPGTENHKGDTPVPVTVVSTGKTVAVATLRNILGVKEQKVLGPPPAHALSPMGQQIQSSMETSFAKIMRSGSCAQLVDIYANQAEVSEPRWFSALSIAKFCKDKDKAIHKLSSEHPDYDPIRTEQKISHILGPHTCAEFEKHKPELCANCPHFGKIKSPIVLGKELAVATEEDNIVEEKAEDGTSVTYHIPEYPLPFARGKKGGIWMKVKDGEEAVDVMVYPYDFYLVKRMEDPNEGSVILFRHHTPHDGVQEFTVPASKVMDGNELRKILASKHVVASKKNHDALVMFVIRSFEDLFSKKKAELMRNQFGWADGDSKFILGDTEIAIDGTYFSPPSSMTKVMADHMIPVGTLDAWKEVFNLYGLPGMEAAAFAAATAFGAPLLRFSGQRGAIINLVNTHSGTGKTTALYMCNSVWGAPDKLCSKKDDTFNSKVHKLGVMCNLPVTFDEMSNTEPKQLSELAYLITQGTGKDRMKASANELRVNNTSWQTIALCSSNHSFYEKLEGLKDSPQGEMMRIIEYPLDYSSAIDTETGKQMFDHQLMENYGHAGPIYARHLIKEYEKVKSLYNRMQARIDAQCKLTQRERFWSATAAANLTGLYIARQLGLWQWKVAPVFDWVCNMIDNLRATTVPPPEGNQQIISDFLVSHIENMLVINGIADRRTKLQELPLLEPKRELMVRYEPDTEKVYITVAAFRTYCNKRSIGYRETCNKLRKIGMLEEKSANMRITKGMKVNLPPVQCLVFDASHPEFAKMESFVPEEQDADSGG